MERIKFTGERFVPGIEDEILEIEHMQRYYAIRELVAGKKILDAASGEGYGSNILAETAAEVIGLDISEEAVKNASRIYGEKKNLSYKVGSIANLPFEDDSFDVVVSFETIEHVAEEVQIEFLKEAKRVLKDEGILVISTPNKEIYSDRNNYHNEFHVKEFYIDEFTEFLKRQFDDIRVFYQYFEIASVIDSSNLIGKSDFRRDKDYRVLPKYVIAIAGNTNIKEYKMQSVQIGSKTQYLLQADRIIELQAEEEKRNKHIAYLDAEIEEKNSYICKLQKEEKFKDSIIRENDAVIDNLQKEIADRRKNLQELEQKIVEIQNTYETEVAKNELLEQELRNKNGHIEQLLEVEREFEREKKTRCYKAAVWIRKAIGYILPSGSKREFFAYILYQCIKNPKLMIKMINFTRVKNFFIVLKKEGMNAVWYNYQLTEDFEKLKISTKPKIDIIDVEEKSLAEYKVLEFTQWKQPVVSIIIPVYNQFVYTYRCLESILKNTNNIKYEIIIANDCSTDQTKELSKVVSGLRIINNRTNLRFLRNCNNAAKCAKGKYILFLNNDTQVQENWLNALLELIENDQTIGMIGSKLIYPDGYLQEAGGIVWNDGSAWNFGHRKLPDEAEYNYVKDVDYISGAAIMIRKSLWKEIGGFDERFAPAYYEDTDLAFEVRKHGYRVVYQPLSVVVHFEGISNGTDVGQGIKSYQVENQKKFYEKWKTVLEKEHFPNAEAVFLAKDRSRFKKQILVVDHYIPNYDKDAGGKCTYMYLKAFLKMGMKVTFIGDNFAKMEPYATELNQAGIEILYGNYYYNNWKEWLKENLKYFDYVYLQRPHISIKYIDIVKEYARGKIFYFAHDLHHLREYRQYQLDHNPETLKSSEDWKRIEYDLFRKADVGHVVGSYEQRIMQEVFPDKPVRNIPLYIYEDELKDVQKDFSKRTDIVYVGGFGHLPNEDAVLWFAKEVFPKILCKYPMMKWHVVGSKVTKAVQALASDNIIIEGFLPDEELHKLYSNCRMAVVPLRYGAGVKGKVVESAYFQIPLVTTSIGAEGLDCTGNPFVIEDDAEKMAEKICDLYEDYDELRKLSDKGKDFISKNFTLKVAMDVLKADMDI